MSSSSARARSLQVVATAALVGGAVFAAVGPLASVGQGDGQPDVGAGARGLVATSTGHATAVAQRGRDLVAVPAGFPSAATTGAAPGSVLTRYTGNVYLRQRGQTLSNALIDGCVTIQADKVTIRNSIIICHQRGAVLDAPGSVEGTRLDHVEIDGAGVAAVGLSGRNVLATALNVHDAGDGVRLGRDSTLQDSYVHDLATQDGIHHDDLQTTHNSRASHIRVLHNTLLAYTPGTQNNTAYHMGSGAISDVSLQNNFMDGGHYTIAVDNGPDQRDIVVRGNRFGRHYHYNILGTARKGDAVDFTGNTWLDDGRPATPATAQGHGMMR